MVELTASGDAGEVEARLREAIDAHGLELFARINHAAGARKAGVELEANVLLILGNPAVGTPLMQADPHVGIELPLRMLIWQDPDGTRVGFLDPRALANRYALDGHQQTLERQSHVLAELAAAAGRLSERWIRPPGGSRPRARPAAPARGLRSWGGRAAARAARGLRFRAARGRA